MRIKILIIVLIISLSSMVTGCHAGMTGTVIDAESGKPIEGAVVLVEWTYTSGKWIGLRSTSSYKVVETVTDKEGKFKVSGVLNPFVDPPDVTIYKRGYVAWNNKFIFPDYAKRTDFRWEKGYVFRMEKFREKYSYNDHTSFISDAIHSWSASENKDVFKKAYEWEENEAFKERREKRN